MHDSRDIGIAFRTAGVRRRRDAVFIDWWNASESQVDH
jgi:hypothetical protein